MSAVFKRVERPRKRCKIDIDEDENGAIGAVCFRHGYPRYMFGRHHTNTIEGVVKTFRRQWRQSNALLKDPLMDIKTPSEHFKDADEEMRRFSEFLKHTIAEVFGIDPDDLETPV